MSAHAGPHGWPAAPLAGIMEPAFNERAEGVCVSSSMPGVPQAEDFTDLFHKENFI